MQKFLGKLNSLRQFIFNLLGKSHAFALILHLKIVADFTWGGGGAEQPCTFDNIKK
jgi:hypothetical protein